MQNVVQQWQAFNSWSMELPIYLQVFLGMSMFFVGLIALLAAIYFTTRTLLKLSTMPLLSHVVGLLGYALMFVVGLAVYVALPLILMALSSQQSLDISLITQAIVIYFLAFFMLSVVIMDFMDSRQLWDDDDYTLSSLAKLFNASVWVLALGYPALQRWRQN